MISLLKKVTRQCLRLVVHSGRYSGRKLIVSLCPGDLLEFRIKGTRQVFTVPLAHCYMLAEILHANDSFADAMAKYKSGHARKRPKKAILPYNKIFYHAIK